MASTRAPLKPFWANSWVATSTMLRRVPCGSLIRRRCALRPPFVAFIGLTPSMLCRGPAESKQAHWRLPQQLAAVLRIREQPVDDRQERAVVQPLRRPQERPVRAPQATIE